MEKENCKKEFCIYIKNGRGTPYIQASYRTFQDAFIALNNMIGLEEERNRFYYVDNDFFDNKYPPNMYGKYFSILERVVGEWKKYEHQNTSSKSKTKRENGKILMFRQRIG